MSPLRPLLIAVSLLAASPALIVRAEPPTQSTSAPAPEPAAKVIATATTAAKAHDHKVLVVFHASWCGWCKRLDAKLLNNPAMSKLLAAHYEIVHLDVQESTDKKALENPGADKLMATLGGEKSGLPFYAILNTNGKKLADSNRMPGNANIGYPGAPDEITAFVKLLAETAPKMTEAERAAVADHLKKNEPAT